MRKILSIGWVNTLRFLRERSNLFFVFVFPVFIIMLLGVMYGGGFDTRLGVYVDGAGGPASDGLVAALDDLEGVTVLEFESAEGLVDGVQRARATGGVLIPAAYETAMGADGTAEITYVGQSGDAEAQLLRVSVGEVLAVEAAPIRAARFAAAQGADFAAALEQAGIVVPLAERVTVGFREAGEPVFEGFEEMGAFDMGASQQLILFMFLISLAGSAALIQTRRLGVARRMLSTPTTTMAIVGGETLGRFTIAVIQGVYIMLGTLVVFGVDWGDPLGAMAILVVFALVGAGAAMLMGSVFHNDQQAGGLGVLAGLGLAALGGAMVPIEIFPDTMQTVAKFTPHAWGIDAFAELVRRDGSLIDILPQLGVLLAFAAVLLLLATWRLHRVLTR
jgi:ABC-2 type transport system permease protein